jgi:hypothetical protein
MCQLFLSDINETCFRQILEKIFKYQTLWKSVQWQRSYYMLTDWRRHRQADGRDDSFRRSSQFCDGAQEQGVQQFHSSVQKLETSAVMFANLSLYRNMYVKCYVVQVESSASQTKKSTYDSGAVKQGAESRLQEVTGEKIYNNKSCKFFNCRLLCSGSLKNCWFRTNL